MFNGAGLASVWAHRPVLLSGVGMELECIPIEKDEGTSAILGHAGFIKTVEDLYEAMLCSVPGVKFGIAFAEASGPCLVRSEGNDEGLRAQAERSILKIAAGHTFLILFTGAYPINVITNVRTVSEVAAVYCATSNPVQVIVAIIENGRSVIGIIDGLSSRAIESKDDSRIDLGS
jgi:adenosine/AMP kinase